MMFKNYQTDHMLAKHFGIEKHECQKLIKVIKKRKRSIDIKSGLVFLSVSCAWMIFFGRGTDALEGTRFDILNYLNDSGPIGVILVLLLGIGTAIFLAVITAVALERRLLYRQFHYHLFTPACFWCGYSLKGLENENNYIKCPECGERSRTGS